MSNPRTPAGGAITAFPARAEAVTPSDTTTYPLGIAIYVGGDGDVSVEPLEGGNVVVFSMTAGQVVPVTVRRVLAATTATGLVGLY